MAPCPGAEFPRLPTSETVYRSRWESGALLVQALDGSDCSGETFKVSSETPHRRHPRKGHAGGDAAEHKIITVGGKDVLRGRPALTFDPAIDCQVAMQRGRPKSLAHGDPISCQQAGGALEAQFYADEWYLLRGNRAAAATALKAAANIEGFPYKGGLAELKRLNL
jgi:hypothetical protein